LRQLEIIKLLKLFSEHHYWCFLPHPHETDDTHEGTTSSGTEKVETRCGMMINSCFPSLTPRCYLDKYLERGYHRRPNPSAVGGDTLTGIPARGDPDLSDYDDPWGVDESDELDELDELDESEHNLSAQTELVRPLSVVHGEELPPQDQDWDVQALHQVPKQPILKVIDHEVIHESLTKCIENFDGGRDWSIFRLLLDFPQHQLVSRGCPGLERQLTSQADRITGSPCCMQLELHRTFLEWMRRADIEPSKNVWLWESANDTMFSQNYDTVFGTEYLQLVPRGDQLQVILQSDRNSHSNDPNRPFIWLAARQSRIH